MLLLDGTKKPSGRDGARRGAMSVERGEGIRATHVGRGDLKHRLAS